MGEIIGVGRRRTSGEVCGIASNDGFSGVVARKASIWRLKSLPMATSSSPRSAWGTGKQFVTSTFEYISLIASETIEGKHQCKEAQ